MDSSIPEVDGYEARNLRKCETQQLTSRAHRRAHRHAVTEDRSSCLDAGMDHHLIKPVKLDDCACVRPLGVDTGSGRRPEHARPSGWLTQPTWPGIMATRSMPLNYEIH